MDVPLVPLVGWRAALLALSGPLVAQLRLPLNSAFSVSNGGVKVHCHTGAIVSG